MNRTPGDALGVFTFLEKRRTIKGKHGRTHFLVRCFCGNEKLVALRDALRAKSCGCQTKRILHEARTIHGHAKNYGVESRTYKSWKSMFDRCYLLSHKSYADYGGRGITVCERWHSFPVFLADMGERPEFTTLGRKDNERGYEPDNCSWQTHKEQARNRRNSAILTLDGISATVAEWVERTGLSYDTLQKRIEKGWGTERSLTTPAKRQKNSRGTWLAA